MRRNNFSRFNPRQIEEHLSPFGRQVLGTLIKQWSSVPVPCAAAAAGDDRNLNNSSQFKHPVGHNNSQRRVLTFGESNIRANSPLNDAINLRSNVDDNFLFRASENFTSQVPSTARVSEFPLRHAAPHILPPPSELSSQLAIVPAPVLHSTVPTLPVPTSAELVTAANSPNDAHISLSREDLVTSINESSIINERNRFVVDNDENPKYDDVLQEARDVLDRCQRNIDWDDMFDTELLSDVDPPAKNVVDATNHANSEKMFNSQFPNSVVTSTHAKTDSKSTKIIQDSNIKRPKRKMQSKVTDGIPKKVKKIKSESKTKSKNISKQKDYFEESFRIWLNDVNSNSHVQEELQESLQVEKQIPTILKEKPKVTIPINGASEKIAKKIVQAQLANKGGKMKYDKPTKNNTVTTEEDSISDENKFKEKVVAKEKKPKPKFVAPIKSQIPVEEITYEIHEVNEANVGKFKFDETIDRELIALLLYSNGFCQLNSQHTEEACVPEAILFNVDDVFFYLKEDGKHVTGTVTRMLQNNVVICYDGKSLLNYLTSKMNLEFDVFSTFNIIDVKIAGCLLEPDSPPETFPALQRLASSETEFTIATTCAKQKAAWYASLLRNVASGVRTKLELDHLWDVFVDIEMQILPIIADMEQRGVCVDMDRLKEMERILLAKMKQVESECMTAAGRSFQINSTVQVRALLYDELRLDEKAGLKVRGTLATGAKSTSETMLKSLVSFHPLPRLILEYRHLHKAHATFLQGIAQYVRGGVVRPVWVQTAAATGRIASSNPNLQAIPKVPFNLRLFPESSGNDEEALRFRCVYVARPGHVLLAADWRHVECRVFARAAADTALQRALEAPDLFRRLAADWLQKTEDEVSPEDRERTKRIVYASLYGAGPRKLMDILDVDYSQALSIAASFDRTFPSLRSFGRRVAADCLSAGGRVASLCGRARTLAHIASARAEQRSHAERQALNFIVQGSAADICKLAMAKATRAVISAGLCARLLLQIHDELVWEIPHQQLHSAAEVIREAMEQCGARAGLTSLPVALAAGPSWGELTPYPPSNEPRHDWESQEFDM